MNPQKTTQHVDHKIPREVLETIFQFLIQDDKAPKYLVNVSRTCKNWYLASQVDSLQMCIDLNRNHFVH